MNRVSLIKHLVATSVGLVVLFWTLYLMVTPLKYAWGIVLFFITVTCVEMQLSGSSDSPDLQGLNKPSVSSRIPLGELLVVGALVLSLAILFLVPPIEGEIFVEWASLGLPNVVRLFVAFGMNFLPGYVILCIVRNNVLDRLSKLVTSYFLSLFVMTMTAFVSARVVGVVDELFLEALSIVCTALILIYFLRLLLHRRVRSETGNTSTSSSSSNKKTLPDLLVLLAVVFIGVCLLWVYSRIGFFFGSPGSDMWRLNGAAQAILDYEAFHWLYYPWWFDLYLSSFTLVSGVPSANAYLALYPLIVLPVLSFYLMTSVFFKDKRMASLATLGYGIFSGPAWLYAIFLRNLSPSIGFDAWKQILYAASDKFLLQGRYPPFPLGFTGAVVAYASLWWMIYATLRLNMRRKSSLFLLSTTLAMSYLIHGIEPIVFLVYLLALLIAYSFAHNGEGKKRIGWAAMSVLIGIGIVALIDISLTAQYDAFNSIIPNPNALATRYFYFNSPSFYLLASGAVSLIVLSRGTLIRNGFRGLLQNRYNRFAQKHVESFRKRVAELIFYFYGVSLIVFVMLFSSLTITSTLLGSVPWYVYLVIGGVPSFLGLVGVAIVLRRWNKLDTNIKTTVLYCSSSVVLLFVFGQAISFINANFFYTHFWERRTSAYVAPMMSMLMAYALVALLKRTNEKDLRTIRAKYIGKIGLVSLLTSLIIIGSVSSALMAGDFASMVFFAERPTEAELEALQYLHYSLPKGVKTGYVNRRTGIDYIRAFANDKWTHDPELWLGQYYYSAYSVLSAIQRADIRLLYLNRIRDSRDLQKNVFLQQLIKVLPVAFNNSEATIYSIPTLQFPSPTAPLGLLSPREKAGILYDSYTLWSLTLATSTYPYKLITNSSNPDILGATSTILVSYDPPNVRDETAQLMAWVANGGHLIVSNTNEFGIVDELLGLKAKTPLVNCDSTDNWRTVYGTRGRVILEEATKIEGTASLRLQNNLSSWEGYIYTPAVPWNLTQYEYLGIWVYGTGGGPLFYLWLTDSNGTETFYKLALSTYEPTTRTWSPSFNGWKLVLVPIKQHYSSLDLSSVKRLKIDTGYTMPVNILIDEVFALEETAERPYVAVNGIQGATIIGLPEIEVQSLSPSSGVSVIANYTQNSVPVTPFAIQVGLGNGKITYLNISSLYQSILSGTSGFTANQILAKVIEILQVGASP